MAENKVVLIGQSGVGKTCIINQFINGEYDDTVTSTISFQFLKKHLSFQVIIILHWIYGIQQAKRNIVH